MFMLPSSSMHPSSRFVTFLDIMIFFGKHRAFPKDDITLLPTEGNINGFGCQRVMNISSFICFYSNIYLLTQEYFHSEQC